MRTHKSTMIELVQELEALLPNYSVNPDRTTFNAVEIIIAEAKAGEYHDYKNNKYICGKVEVVNKLRAARTPALCALADRVADGEFDEEADEEDQAMLRGYMDQIAQDLSGL